MLRVETQSLSQDSLGVADVGDGAVEGDAVADVDVEAVLPVGLVHPVSVCHGERFSLLAVTCSRKKQR